MNNSILFSRMAPSTNSGWEILMFMGQQPLFTKGQIINISDFTDHTESLLYMLLVLLVMHQKCKNIFVGSSVLDKDFIHSLGRPEAWSNLISLPTCGRLFTTITGQCNQCKLRAHYLKFHFASIVCYYLGFFISKPTIWIVCSVFSHNFYSLLIYI